MMKLPKKQLEVLELLYSGLSIKEIAAQLGKRETTIKTHKDRILKKFNCCSLRELMAIKIEELNKENIYLKKYNKKLNEYKNMWEFVKERYREDAKNENK